jgi:hypothetical protein
MWIKKLQGGMIPAIQGSLTCIPADVVTSVESLPSCSKETDTVKAELKKKIEHKTVYYKENIRPK